MSMQTNKKNNINTKNKDNKPIIKCNYYKIKGHKESSCYRKNPSLRPNKSVNNSTSKEEEQILTSYFNKSNNSTSTIDVILDSSATIHTCYIKELFTSLKPTNTFFKQGNTSNSIKA